MSLSEKYSGKVAAEYLARRVGSEKWRFEQDSVLGFLRQMQPLSILDVPIGTGRFVADYPAAWTGMDSSADMLDQADASVQKIVCDVLSEESPEFDCSFDMALCIRFLNWLDIEDVEFMLRKLRRWASFAVVSISTADEAHVRHTGANIFSHDQAAMAIQGAGFSIVGEEIRVDGVTSRIMLLS